MVGGIRYVSRYSYACQQILESRTTQSMLEPPILTRHITKTMLLLGLFTVTLMVITFITHRKDGLVSLSSCRPMCSSVLFPATSDQSRCRVLNVSLCRPESDHAVRHLRDIILQDGLALTSRDLIEQIAETGVDIAQQIRLKSR